MMNTNRLRRPLVLVAIVAAALLQSAPAQAGPKPQNPSVLFNQMGGMEYVPGWDPLSEHRADGSEVQSAADDFTVPARRTWTLTTLDVAGEAGRSIATLTYDIEFDITLYRADGPGGGPGTAVAPTVRTMATKIDCCNDVPGWRLPLPNITVGSGTYWVSAALVTGVVDDGSFYWRGYSTRNGARPRYHTPTSGGWQTLPHVPPDLEYRLTGTSA